MRPARITTKALALGIAGLLAAPSVALAAGPHVVVEPAFLGFVGSAIGSVFHAIAGVVLGGLDWTVGVAGKFILNLLGGLIRLLIPASWAKDGLAVMHWIVAVPDYAGTISTPGGHVVYGFAGVNALRDLFEWTGAALLPLTLVYATSRAAFAGRGPVAAPVGRVLALAAVLVSYPFWWAQAAAVVNQLTHFILGLPAVSHGIYRLMQYAVGGVALGGWQLIDLALMGAIGIALLGLIFLKVVVILLGALLYAVGPLMIALVPSDGGLVIARAWASAAVALVALPVVWSTILAVGALLINDSATAGPLIAGSGTIASLLGGLLLALAGLAALWLCLRAAREAGSLVRGQLSGVLALGHGRGVSTGSVEQVKITRASESIRSFTSRLAGATGAALEAGGPSGGALVAGTRRVAASTRVGLVGAVGTGVRAGAVALAPGTAALVSRTRAGAAAVRMARAGTASWQQTSTNGPVPPPPAASHGAGSAAGRGGTTPASGPSPSARGERPVATAGGVWSSQSGPESDGSGSGDAGRGSGRGTPPSRGRATGKGSALGRGHRKPRGDGNKGSGGRG